MSTCIFCSMLARKRIQLRDLLLVSLTKDPDGRAYLKVELPVCPEHDQIPGVLERVPGERPVMRLYDEGANLFQVTHVLAQAGQGAEAASFARCASCGHLEPEHDVGEDGGCGMDCGCPRFEARSLVEMG